MCFNCVNLESLILLGSSIPSDSYLLSASSSSGFPKSGGEGFGGDIKVRAERFKYSPMQEETSLMMDE